MSRSNIPSELKRRVLCEAGHRCAIPTCREIIVEVHHIVSWSECKEHNYENLITLCPNCHRLADRKHIDRKSLRIYKANLRYTHDKFSQLEVDLLFQLYKIPENENNKGIPWSSYLLLLFNRILEVEYIKIRHSSEPVALSGGIPSPVLIFFTEKGREYIDSLGIDQKN